MSILWRGDKGYYKNLLKLVEMKPLEVKHNGDYKVSTYKLNNRIVELWEDVWGRLDNHIVVR